MPILKIQNGILSFVELEHELNSTLEFILWQLSKIPLFFQHKLQLLEKFDLRFKISESTDNKEISERKISQFFDSKFFLYFLVVLSKEIENQASVLIDYYPETLLSDIIQSEFNLKINLIQISKLAYYSIIEEFIEWISKLEISKERIIRDKEPYSSKYR